MRNSVIQLGILALTVLVLGAGSLAAQEAAPEADEPQFEVTLSGFYAFNGYSQNNFFLGRDAPGLVSDDDQYGIQLLRLQPEIRYGENLKAVARIDMAQGIWGVDNSQRETYRPGFSNLFNEKDTNFEIHVDWAYVEARVEKLGGTLVRVGRMKNSLGNLLVLDQDGDGFQVEKEIGGWNVLFDWTKQFEGVDGLTDEDFGTGGIDGEDADLVYLEASRSFGGLTWTPYVAYYRDKGDDDGTTYLPQELQYFKPRFQPNVSSATVLGLSWAGKAAGYELKGEVDWLTGEDDVDNATSGPRELLDVNNGDLEGYNLYLDAKRPMGPGTLGAVFGMGSGDDDPMAGDGNINKIRTNGFFYVTEVWEDSVMPDEEGITPQGLGSPASRGYRELENTTLVQLNYTWPFRPDWKLFVSGTWLQATEDLRPWADTNGDGRIDPSEVGPPTADDLGSEIDARLDWQVMPHLTWTLRGGYFFTGEAAALLIHGTDLYQDDAWELRTTIRFGFDGIKLAGGS